MKLFATPIASIAGASAAVLKRTLLSRLPITRRASSTKTSPPPPAQSLRREEALFAYSTSTIYALSTAPGRAGIAVIRISGPSALPILASLCPAKPRPRPRHAAVRTLHDPESPSSIILDASALVLYFPGPKSVTGEDVVELHVHGGTATVRAVLGAIPRCKGATAAKSGGGSGERARYAGPGEFTRRAFMSGRLDLTQVEALGDTLAAETEQQRRAAVRGAATGKRVALYEAWRGMLLLARAELEALIDFSEDQAFDESSARLFASTHGQIKPLLRAMEAHELAGSRSELLRNGISVALLGPVNVGKSSLMNTIVGREASIVSGEAGTTRDVVEARLDLGGFLCSFADTAGIRAESGDNIGAVELEGIRRARVKAGEAAVVVVMASIESGGRGTTCTINFDEETLKLAEGTKASLLVVNKCDAVGPDTLTSLLASLKSHVAANYPRLQATPIPISCHEANTYTDTNTPSPPAASTMSPHFPPTDPGGVHALTEALVARFATLTEMPNDNDPDLLGVTERQRQLLAECRHFLREFAAEAERASRGEGQEDVVLAAEYLRFAASCLARITGRGEAGDVNEVLGVVFERFCVGK